MMTSNHYYAQNGQTLNPRHGLDSRLTQSMAFEGGQDRETQFLSNPVSYPTTSQGRRPYAPLSKGSASMKQIDPARRTQKNWSNQPNLMGRDIDSANSMNLIEKHASYINITSTLKNDIRPMNGIQNSVDPRMYMDTANKSTRRKLARIPRDK